MEESVFYCNDPLKQGCSWSGDRQELVSKTDDPKDLKFSYCPYCGGDDFTEENEE